MKFSITILSIALIQSVYAHDGVIPEVTNFQELGMEMEQKNMGLVMMLHTDDCTFCDLMDEKVLSPMVKSKEYEERVFIRKLQTDKSELITDFDGQKVEVSKVAEVYGAPLTPSLLFLDSKGKEKADKIVGFNSLDFFSMFVDKKIDELLIGIESNDLK